MVDVLIVHDDIASVITTKETQQILVGVDPEPIVIATTENEILLTVDTEVDVIEIGTIGPQGPRGLPGNPGTTEDNMPYAKKVDFVNDNVIYIGRATVGSNSYDSLWQISKTTFVDEDVSQEWADGTADFSKVWDSRTTYTYR